MKRFVFLIVLLFFLLTCSKSFASYDPLSKPNNKFGIHILYPEEVSEASELVNSNGGDWGYVTIAIQSSDKNLLKWQKFMDNAKKYHIIPIMRLATDGNYFEKSSWSKPTDYNILDFANFLDSLSWPTENRYIIVFNEQNRGDEWGGSPDASSYAKILDYAVDTFKAKNKDFFIIMGGLDNASANIEGQSVNQFTYMSQMESAVPGIFSKIDGLSSHSYPNPGFSQPPSSQRVGVNSFYYQKQLIESLSDKHLPIFITETGWSSDAVPLGKQAQYYIQTFKDYWNNENIVAVTPFIFHAEQGPFLQFSFIKNNEKLSLYYNYKNFTKVKGEPVLSKDFSKTFKSDNNLPTKEFAPQDNLNSVFKKVNSSAKTFFKWLLRA